MSKNPAPARLPAAVQFSRSVGFKNWVQGKVLGSPCVCILKAYSVIQASLVSLSHSSVHVSFVSVIWKIGVIIVLWTSTEDQIVKSEA